MRTYKRILIAFGVGILLVLFDYNAIQASRRATEKSLRESSEYVFRMEQKWIEEQKERLLSGQTTHVFFYSTSKSDSLVSQLAGMTEIKRLTFESTDLSDFGVDIVARLPRDVIHDLMKLGQLKKLNVGGGWLSSSNIAELKSALPDCEVVDNFADDEW